MTDPQTDNPPPHRLLPVTVVPGVPVYDVAHEPAGTVAAITESYCVFRLANSEQLAVLSWADVALGNTCPASPLLDVEVAARDRRNAQATLLRESLYLKRLAPLTAVQTAAYQELTAALLK